MALPFAQCSLVSLLFVGVHAAQQHHNPVITKNLSRPGSRMNGIARRGEGKTRKIGAIFNSVFNNTGVIIHTIKGAATVALSA
jgi:hypothetical protein